MSSYQSKVSLILEGINNTQDAFGEVVGALGLLGENLVQAGNKSDRVGSQVGSLTQKLGFLVQKFNEVGIASNQNAAAMLESSHKMEASLQRIADQADKTGQHMHMMGKGLADMMMPVAAIMAVRKLGEEVMGMVKSLTTYTSTIEQGQLSIAASLTSAGSFMDKTTGKALQGMDAFHAAQSKAKDVTAQLQTENLKTSTTLDNMIYAYEVTLPMALSRGFNLDQVMSFNTAMVQTMGLLNRPMETVAQESRSLLTGAINVRTSKIATVLGITSADIAAHKHNATELYNFLMSKLQWYVAAAPESMKTLKGSWTNLKDVVLRLGSEAFQPVFDEMKHTIIEATSSIATFESHVDETGKKTMSIKWNPEALQVVKDLTEGIRHLISLMERVVKVGGFILSLFSGLRDQAFYLAVATGIGVIATALARAAASGGWIGAAVTGLAYLGTLAATHVNSAADDKKDADMGRRAWSVAGTHASPGTLKDIGWTQDPKLPSGEWIAAFKQIRQTYPSITEDQLRKLIIQGGVELQHRQEQVMGKLINAPHLNVATPDVLKSILNPEGTNTPEYKGNKGDTRTAKDKNAEVSDAIAKLREKYDKIIQALRDKAEKDVKAMDIEISAIAAKNRTGDQSPDKTEQLVAGMKQKIATRRKELDQDILDTIAPMTSEGVSILSAGGTPTRNSANIANFHRQQDDRKSKLNRDITDREADEQIEQNRKAQEATKAKFDEAQQKLTNMFPESVENYRATTRNNKDKIYTNQMTNVEAIRAEVAKAQEEYAKLVQAINKFQGQYALTSKEKAQQQKHLDEFHNQYLNPSVISEKTKEAGRLDQIEAYNKQVGDLRQKLEALNETRKEGDTAQNQHTNDEQRVQLLAQEAALLKSIRDLQSTGSPAWNNANQNVLKSRSQGYSAQIESAKTSDDFLGGMKEGFYQFGRNASATFNLGDELAKGAASSMSSSLGAGFFDIIEGKFTNLRKVASQFFLDLAKMIVDMLAKMAVMNMMSSMFPGSSITGTAGAAGGAVATTGGGIFSGLASLFGMGGGAASAGAASGATLGAPGSTDWASSMFPAIFGAFHTGGILGDTPPMTRAFSMPRFHIGGALGADEVPFIGKTGEGVLSHRGMENLSKLNSNGFAQGGDAQKAGDIHVNIPIDASGGGSNNSGSDSVKVSQMQQLGSLIKSKVVEVIADQQRQGGILYGNS